MVRFHYSAAQNIFEAEIVIIGVPDESKSHAIRKGASKGPDIIRHASNESEFFERNGKIIPICPLVKSDYSILTLIQTLFLLPPIIMGLY